MTFFEDLTDEDRAQQYLEQGTEEWEAARCGRFTSSEMYKIMEPGKRPMTEIELKQRPSEGPGKGAKLIPDISVLSDAAQTYIRIKVAETLTGRVERSGYAWPLVYGVETEPQAVEHFEKLTGLTCEPVGFVPMGAHSGGSPDRLVSDGAILEVKCPANSKNQIDYLMLTDQYDLKRMHPDHYWQCMANLLFTGKNKCYYATFDPRFKLEKHKMFLLEILPKADEFNAITQKLAVCVEEKLKLIELLS